MVGALDGTQEWLEQLKDEAVRKAKEEEEARIVAEKQKFKALGELLVRRDSFIS